MEDKQGKKKLHRDYGMFLDSGKYNRNWGFKYHDNAYGINGGGGAVERRAADSRLYDHMRREGDPMAPVVYAVVRVFGWAFFNYHRGAPLSLWRGQLIKKIFKSYRAK